MKAITRKTKPPIHLAAWRRRKGLTQAQLAERAGIAQPTIANLERLHWKTVHDSTAEKLATALGIPTNQLYWPPETEGAKRGWRVVTRYGLI